MMDPAIKWSQENDEDEAASMSRRQGDVQTILVSFFQDDGRGKRGRQRRECKQHVTANVLR